MLSPGRHGHRLAAFAIVAAIAHGSQPSAVAQVDALDGTVFIRLIGNVRILRGAVERVWREELLNLREVELGNGSGFVISPHRWVVTNHHVVTGEKAIVTIRGQKVEVTIDVARIEVVLPSESPGQTERRYQASARSNDSTSPARRAVCRRPRKRAQGHYRARQPESPSGDPAKLLYAVVDVGKEKIVARYVGSADMIAANQSLLLASLAELEVAPLLTAEVTRALPATWNRAVRPETSHASIQTLEGWVTEPGVPWQCAAGLQQPPAGLAMSPAGDFTVMLRAAWHSAPIEDVRSTSRNAPMEKSGFVTSVFGEWIKAIAR